MSRTWLFMMVVAAMAVGLCGTAEAQRANRTIDPNTYGGKFSTGGFGFEMRTAFQISGDLYRGQPVPTATPGISALGKGPSVARDESVMGLGLNWQFGTDQDVMGAILKLDFNFHTIDTVGPTSAASGGLPVPGSVTTFSVTTSKLGFNLIWNPLKSLNRSVMGRDPLFDKNPDTDFGFSLVFGPNLGFMAGDLGDINGLATFGFDIGAVFDIPLGDANEFNLVPAFWFETNYHMSGDAQVDIFNSTEQSPTGVGQNDGVVLRSHNFLPPHAWNIGADFVWRPRFGANQENNHWRFSGGMWLNVPFAFNTFFAEDPGDAWRTDGRAPVFLTFSFGFAYVW